MRPGELDERTGRMHDVRLRGLASSIAIWVPPLLVGVIVFGCGGTASRSAPTSGATSASTSTRPAADVVVTAQSFRSLRAMTPIRGFFVANVMGDLKKTVAVANSKKGGVYPPGSVLQLVPQEAMVKHRAGWSASTGDWEFFSLDVSPTGTRIVTRGKQEVVNRFGGNCAACHAAAKSQFDFVCEHDHGCAPLPVADAVIDAIQLADPRP